jgi:glucose-1-phosphate adenylyltransferase
MEFTHLRPSLSLNGTWPILTEESNLPPAKIAKQGRAENSLVSPGCVIKGRVENSILSPGVWVEEKAVVKNSILMSNVFVGHGSIIDSSILDEAVTVSRLCYVGIGAGAVSGGGGVTLLGKGTTVPPQSCIGRNCRIEPLGDYSDFTADTLPPGMTVLPNPAAT